MMMALQIWSFAMSMFLMFLTHPLSLGLVLLLQTVSISLMIGYYHYNFWYSYILFLIMIGGMLVLFAYMTSVASNEKFKFSLKLTMMMGLIVTSSMIIHLMVDLYFSHINNNSMEVLESSLKFNLSLNKFLNYPSSILTMGLIIYLLVALVAIVKITNISSGPLRQSN
uniref:NADH-ubiquinone oxidoreductase chain 6 n=1 Tax=Bolboceratex sp. BOL01 TaxID=1205609 RepID=A0A0S2MNP9_9SCAR|nr:NADH deshydrogenase subunit 6 [Bolboceratex sp. BOL01]